MRKVVTRFPPSPTGYFHIGSARTALFNHLFAAHHEGVMYLRFEDTDKARCKEEYEKDIIDGLTWLGIPYTEGDPLRQSEKGDVYRTYLHSLIEKGAAYEAEEAEGSGNVVRFKNPNVRVTFTDLIRGEVSFDTTELKDFVIARNVNDPLYQFSVVADDHDMGVTHVIRGEDHISNTPRQILILEALSFERPTYAHIPLILAPDRTKLSKRHGAVSVNEYRAQGYLPEAIVNYLALLGWNPGGEEELFSMEDLERHFSLEKVHKNGAIFSTEKLRWFNHEQAKKLSQEEYGARLKSFLAERGEKTPEYFTRVLPFLQERSETLDEAREILFGEFHHIMNLADELPPDPTLLLKGAKTNESTARKHLEYVEKMLEDIKDKDFDAHTVKEILFPYAEKEGKAGVLWPLRVALSARDKSPDPFALAGLLGKEKTLLRVRRAVRALRDAS